MKDWKMWAPLQTKKQREMADNLTATEKKEVRRLTKELVKKGLLFLVPCVLIIYFLFERNVLSSFLTVFLIILSYLLFAKFVGLPIRKKQKSLLNNSKYAKDKGITV